MVTGVEVGACPEKRQKLRCAVCQVRRVKCDRGEPCGACTKKGLTDACKYEVVDDVETMRLELVQRKNYKTKRFENRTSLACLHCQAKKIKCDRKRPCSSCFKKAKHCTYQDGGAAVTTAVPDTMKHSELNANVIETHLGYNPYESSSETINIQDLSHLKHSSIRPTKYGPLSWNFLERKDFALNCLWEYTNDVLKTGETILGEGEVSIPQEEYFTIFEATSGMERHKLTKVLNSRDTKLDSFDSSERRPLQLAEDIRQALPTRRLIRLLFDQYFAAVFPCIAVLDEEELMENTARMLGEITDEDTFVEELKLRDRTDLAHLGILLLVLRFGYLSISTARQEKLDQNQRHILDNPVPLEIVRLSEECFAQFTLLGKPSIPVLQLAMAIRCYQKFAPEFGDGASGPDSEFLSGLVLQMAYSLNYNRDPDNLYLPLSNKMKNLRRTTWYGLIFTDLLSAYSFGTPLMGDAINFDTKRPQAYDPTSERVSKAYKLLDDAMIYLRGSLKKMLTVGGETKMKDLTEEINRFELHLKKSYLTVPELLDVKTNGLFGGEAIGRMKLWYSLRIFLVGAYSHFYMNYEKKGNLKLYAFYWKKLMAMATVTFMPTCYKILDEGSGIFGAMCDLIVLPNLLQFLHRCHLSCLSLFIRLKLTSYGLSKRPTLTDSELAEYAALKEVEDALWKCMGVFLSAVSKLAPKYYFAWRLKNSMIHCGGIIKQDSFYEQNYRGFAQSCPCRFSLEDLKDLHRIFTAGIEETARYSRSVVGNDEDSPYKTDLEDDNSGSNNGDDQSVYTFTESDDPIFNSLIDFNMFSDPNSDKWWTNLSASKGGLNFMYDY